MRPRRLDRIDGRGAGTLTWLVLSAVAGILILRWCGRLPPLGGRTVSGAIRDTETTRLGAALAPLLARNPGVSGIHPLYDARDAFAARYLLAAAAERTLDVQYYIWRKDLSGTLLMKALIDAADRGVRVRLLLDDNNTAGLDTALAAVDSHPRIEVRLFNPLAIRRPRAAGYLADLSRVNRRMHNKSFTADSQVTIIGGRNVGDEYFGATDGVLFADLDVLGIGPVAGEVSEDFDRYWASESSYPADRLLRPVGADEVGRLSAAAERVERDAGAVEYRKAVRGSPFVQELLSGTLRFEWAVTHLISDPPSKALRRAGREELLPEKLGRLFGAPAMTVDLVSPYFVPGASGVALFREWSKRGVRVRVLTNALEATDAALVHAGYAKRRRALLEAGVALYELRAGAGRTTAGSEGPFGSSGSSLHAKTFAVDGRRIFVGSLNFDPRSAELNTEMGFVIDSPALARSVGTAFDEKVPMRAYELRLSESGEIDWVERRGGAVVHHRTEPGTGFWRRWGVSLLSRLPIDWLL